MTLSFAVWMLLSLWSKWFRQQWVWPLFIHLRRLLSLVVAGWTPNKKEASSIHSILEVLTLASWSSPCLISAIGSQGFNFRTKFSIQTMARSMLDIFETFFWIPHFKRICCLVAHPQRNSSLQVDAFTKVISMRHHHWIIKLIARWRMTVLLWLLVFMFQIKLQFQNSLLIILHCWSFVSGILLNVLWF